MKTLKQIAAILLIPVAFVLTALPGRTRRTVFSAKTLRMIREFNEQAGNSFLDSITP